MNHAQQFIKEVRSALLGLHPGVLESMALRLSELKRTGGRLFVLGVGGNAANASHAVNDFRKLCGIEAYAPTDNISELSARVNDEGWPTAFEAWLKVSRVGPRDTVLVLSVGGGAPGVSENLVRAVDYAKALGCTILGVVGRDGGHTAVVGDTVLVVPTVNPHRTTFHVESVQSTVLHALASHPLLQQHSTKWEATRHKAVFVDRDGTLNELVWHPEIGTYGAPHYPDDLKILPGVVGAVRALREAGYLVVVVTNQPDAARGLASFDDIEAVNDRLKALVPVDAVYTCIHSEGCPCKKPEPGLLLQAAREMEIDLEKSWMVGDRLIDQEAGRAAGCRTFLIDPKKGLSQFTSWLLAPSLV